MSTRFTHYFTLCFVCALFTFNSSQAHAFEFNLFGDSIYRSGNHQNSFILGAVNLNAEQKIGDTAYVTIELLFENTHHGFEIDLERFSVANEIGENLEIKMGRFVDPLGFWNHNFHHASLSQDTVSRPFFLELEEQHEGVFPSHLIGVVVAGEYDSWGYQFAVANSSGIDSEEFPTTNLLDVDTINFDDPSTDKTLVFRTTVLALDSLQFGFMYMGNNIVEMAEESGIDAINIKHGDTLFEQAVIGIDYNYSYEDFYSFGEFYQIQFTDNKYLPSANPQTYDAIAFYLQFGYRITNKITSVYRYENLDFPAENSTYFALINVGAQTRHVLSLNYRIEESHAIRFEINRHDPESADSETYYNLQWFFLLL